MTKSERMVKMLGLIYERPGELTVKYFASLYGVNVRSIHRDIRTWQSMGVYIRFSDGGYGVVDMHEQWGHILKQRRLVKAVIDLLALGIAVSEDKELKEQGEKVLKLLRSPKHSGPSIVVQA